MNKRKLEDCESGLTLIEVLIAMIITSIFSLGLSKVVSDASLSLNRASKESIAARQIIRFSNLLKSDITGAKDIIVLPRIPPSEDRSTTSSNPYCNIVAPASTSVAYLFTAKVRSVTTGGISANTFDQSNILNYSTYGLVSYTQSNTSKYFLVRTTCLESSPTIPYESKAENLLELSGYVLGDETGSNFLRCVSLSNITQCPVSSSTRNFSSYRFTLPASVRFATFKNYSMVADSGLIGTFTRKVD